MTHAVTIRDWVYRHPVVVAPAAPVLWFAAVWAWT
jgi:hypothetical protein